MRTIFDIQAPALALELQIAEADHAFAALIKALIAISERLQSLERQRKTARLEQLVADRAWTEVGLELLALGAPDWSLHRLCRLDAEWLCTLTAHPHLPDWLGNHVEFRHATRELALLGAVHSALRQRDAAGHVVSRPLPLPGVAIDCADYR